jgi:hypothetical protein
MDKPSPQIGLGWRWLLLLLVIITSACADTDNPLITTVSPTAGMPGTQVTLTGTRLDVSGKDSIVRFNGVQATLVSATDIQIVTTVPAGATTGYITVTTKDGTGTAPVVFTIPRLLGGAMQGVFLNLSGVVQALAGTAGSSGSTDGTGSAALFSNPTGATTDGTYVYLADTGNSTIRRLTIGTNVVTTLAGSAGQTGVANGAGTDARFNGPTGLTTDGSFLYICDTGNSAIRRLNLTTPYQVDTLAGLALNPGYLDGSGTSARFRNPQGITYDGTYLYVADTGNNAIRRLKASGQDVITLAGQTSGLPGYADGYFPFVAFNTPTGLTTDGTFLYICDTANQLIRWLQLSGNANGYPVGTLAGTAGVAGSTDAVGTAARFNGPQEVTTDGSWLYVSDTGNDTVRTVTIGSGQVATLAGSAGNPGSVDGTGSVARFKALTGITSGGAQLFVADSGNELIRQVR